MAAKPLLSLLSQHKFIPAHCYILSSGRGVCTYIPRCHVLQLALCSVLHSTFVQASSFPRRQLLFFSFFFVLASHRPTIPTHPPDPPRPRPTAQCPARWELGPAPKPPVRTLELGASQQPPSVNRLKADESCPPCLRRRRPRPSSDTTITTANGRAIAKTTEARDSKPQPANSRDTDDGPHPPSEGTDRPTDRPSGN